jgi:vacuolar iron transporter family protein
LKPEARADRQRAREVQSGATRAAVLGVSDGLVTNVALILGVAGAQASGRFVLLAGLASLVAAATWGAGRLFNVTVT